MQLWKFKFHNGSNYIRASPHLPNVKEAIAIIYTQYRSSRKTLQLRSVQQSVLHHQLS